MPKGNKALTLSLIIPVYNEENYLKACLNSVAKQTVMPDEVIVVDNNSTDSTASIATEFKFVRIIKEKKQGILPARNRGFNAATSVIIGRIDGDTRLPRDWVEKVMKYYKNPNHADTALTGGGYFYNIRAPRFNGWAWSQLAHRVNYYVIGHNILWGSNMAFPKKLWEEVKPRVCGRADIHEDMDIAIHLNRLGYKIEYEPSLRVGALLKRVFNNRAELHEHMSRWPKTLHSHGYKLWWFGSVGNILLRVFEPVIYVADFFSRYVLGRKSIK